jgi:Ni/Co efflux regulator RcnB
MIGHETCKECKMIQPVLAAFCAIGLAAAATMSTPALAQGKGDKGGPSSQESKKGGDREKGKPGLFEKGESNQGRAVPPGQIKRYTRGQKLGSDVKFTDIDDLSKWKLKPLGKGEKYVRIDNEVVKIAEDTQTVVEAVGIVDDLLR